MKLSQDELNAALSNLKGWELVQGKLHCELKLKDFQQAWSFMSAAALVSEKLDHHPDWSNCYNRVIIDLWSHDQNGITQRDIKWATSVARFLP